MGQLPPELTSLYRLVRRGSAASVLHHLAARRNLRRMFRPVFEEAVHAVRKSQDEQSSVEDKEKATTWLKEFHARMTNTLALLYNSSHTRGLAHNITRNVSLLRSHQSVWARQASASDRRAWLPNMPHDAPYYRGKVVVSGMVNPPAKTVFEPKARARAVEEHAWGALGELVQMAEGRDGLVLGRMGAKAGSKWEAWKARQSASL